jgi:hypothetical protein
MGLKLNGARQFLAYADDANLLGDNSDTMKKSTETNSMELSTNRKIPSC